MEYSHDTTVLHAAVFHDSLEHKSSYARRLVEIVEAEITQKVGDGEEGARVEPSRNAVGRAIIIENVVGNVGDGFL